MLPAQYPRVAIDVATLFLVKPATLEAIMENAIATVQGYAQKIRNPKSLLPRFGPNWMRRAPIRLFN